MLPMLLQRLPSLEPPGQLLRAEAAQEWALAARPVELDSALKMTLPSVLSLRAAERGSAEPRSATMQVCWGAPTFSADRHLSHQSSGGTS
eukprot:1448085-Alexandrium_andersonii.AAC.1